MSLRTSGPQRRTLGPNLVGKSSVPVWHEASGQRCRGKKSGIEPNRNCDPKSCDGLTGKQGSANEGRGPGTASFAAGRGKRGRRREQRQPRDRFGQNGVKAGVDERPQARADGCAGLHEAPGRLYSSIFRKFRSSSLAYSAKFSWIRRRRPRDIW